MSNNKERLFSPNTLSTFGGLESLALLGIAVISTVSFTELTNRYNVNKVKRLTSAHQEKFADYFAYVTEKSSINPPENWEQYDNWFKKMIQADDNDFIGLGKAMTITRKLQGGTVPQEAGHLYMNLFKETRKIYAQHRKQNITQL
jgi:hypothetical protein